MTRHTVRSFADDLEQLSGEVARLGGLAEHVTASAIAAVVRRDTGLARLVIERDQQIDALQREIERSVTRLLALRQPLAQDLRAALAALKISVDLERVGDLAKNIAKRTLVLNQADPIDPTRGVDRMGRLVLAALKDVLDAYSHNLDARALDVWRRDREIDEHHDSLFRELLTFMMEDPRTIGPCAHLLFVAKNLERIGDHATNIAEHVHFLLTGEELLKDRPRIEFPPERRLGDGGGVG